MSKKSRKVKAFVSNNVDEICILLFCLMMLFYALVNTNMSSAKEEIIKGNVGRSPAIVEMYGVHLKQADEVEE